MTQTASSSGMFVSRIHILDIIAVIFAAASRHQDDVSEESGSDHKRLSSHPIVINVADDSPASRQEVFSYSAKLLSQSLPLPEDAANSNFPPSTSVRHQQRCSKKISNAKLKKLLLQKLSYPSYREGLAALLPEIAELHP